MAYAPMRSMNAEFNTGATEKTYKQIVNDRGGFVDAATQDSREHLHDMWYGIHETPDPHAPTRGPVRTQNYRYTPEADPWH